MMTIEEEIYYWKDKYNSLAAEYNKLEELYKKQGSELDKLNYTIRTELEPRIQAEKRCYDRYVLSQAEPKCTCVLGCPYEDTEECLRKQEREEQCN